MTLPDPPRHARLSAAALAELIGAAAPSDPRVAVSGATHHSGRVRPGDAFFALPGADHHGIVHADAALNAGAALIVSDRPHPMGLAVADPGAALLRLGRFARGRLTGPVVGVTGSAGKTTARALLAAALDAEASEGNLNTPHALAGRLVRAWNDDAGRPLVLELGIDRIGEMAELTELVRPDVGLITSIAASHLNGLRDEATVAHEKAGLLRAAPRGLAADAAWRALPSELSDRIVRYGLSSDDLGDAPWRARLEGGRADARPLDADAPDGVSFDGDAFDGDPFEPVLILERPERHRGVRVELPGVGRGLAESAVGALATAELLGVSLEAAARRLEGATLEPGRLQLRRRGSLTIIDDSYNSNPVSARQALELLRSAAAPRVAILGEMLELGDDAARHHRTLGEATLGLELVLFHGPHGDAVRSGNPDARVLDDEAIRASVSRLPREGTILIKASRGMRFERLVAVLTESEPAP